MITLFARLFIKDYKNYSNVTVRNKYGILCGLVGIFWNFVLFSLKFMAGTLLCSVAIQADAFNNLSDAASSIVTVAGFKLASKKPDDEHPFGHGRMEYIAGLIVSFLILMMAFELFKSGLSSFLHPSPINLDKSFFSIAIMIFSVAVKFYMYLYNHLTAKKINSSAMEAVAKDSFSDVLSSSVVIASIVVSLFTDFPADGIGGMIVAIFIFKTGIDATKETINPLLGEPPTKEFVKEIEKEVMKHKPISGIHDLLVHNYGPGRIMISLHAEVPGNINIFELHEACDNAEIALQKKFHCIATIHLDPVDTENKRLPELKSLAVKIAKEIDENISIHDVRIVPGGKKSNLIFDALRPHNCKLTHDELKKELSKRIQKNQSDIRCVITIDDPYV